ncbi:hypothetical protein E4T56_gene17089 [Termitomyces sp. T112]|nr:hypothetical protein E4T56_gene17089 [Termitomyces sp. T112]
MPLPMPTLLPPPMLRPSNTSGFIHARVSRDDDEEEEDEEEEDEDRTGSLGWRIAATAVDHDTLFGRTRNEFRPVSSFKLNIRSSNQPIKNMILRLRSLSPRPRPPRTLNDPIINPIITTRPEPEHDRRVTLFNETPRRAFRKLDTIRQISKHAVFHDKLKFDTMFTHSPAPAPAAASAAAPLDLLLSCVTLPPPPPPPPPLTLMITFTLYHSW